MNTDRRLYDMDLGRREHTRWLGSNARAGGGGPSLPLSWSTDLLFARASTATHWDGTTLTRYSSGDPRILGDGSLYVEGSRTNRLTRSVYTLTPWSVGTSTVTAGAASDPGGATDAAQITNTGGTGPFIEPGATTSAARTASIFVRSVTTGGTILLGLDAYAASTDQSRSHTTSWSRAAVSLTSTGRYLTLRSNTTQVYIWGAQQEAGAFASQLIETAGAAATRLADDAVIEDANVPAALRSGAWETVITPRRASTQANDTSTGTLFAFGAGTDNRIYINASNQVVVREGGVDVVTTSALTWSADQAITLTFDAAAGSVTVAGATTGDGTTADTAWTMPSGDVQVGNDAALGTAFFGGISPPGAP